MLAVGGGRCMFLFLFFQSFGFPLVSSVCLFPLSTISIFHFAGRQHGYTRVVNSFLLWCLLLKKRETTALCCSTLFFDNVCIRLKSDCI